MTASITLNNGACSLNVTVNPSSLAPSNISYYGTINIYPSGSEGLIVPVTVIVTLNPVHDFAGNGLSGALIYNPTDGTAYTALSNGDGTFQYVYNLFTPGFDTLRTGDFNGDGRADLVLYSSKTASAYVGTGIGDGTFYFQSLFWSPGYDFVTSGNLLRAAAGTCDCFALYNSSTGTLYNSSASLGDIGDFGYNYALVGRNYTIAQVVAFGGSNQPAGLFLYRATTGDAAVGMPSGVHGGLTFTPLLISPGYDEMDSGDLYGNGQKELLLYNSSNGNAATGLYNGVSRFIFTPLLFSPCFTSVTLSDFTGERKTDLILYNKNSGVAYFGTGNGVGNFTFQSLFWSPGYDWVMAQDVNGDGKSDVILYNSSTGTEYTGISNGDGTFTYTYNYWRIGKALAK